MVSGLKLTFITGKIMVTYVIGDFIFYFFLKYEVRLDILRNIKSDFMFLFEKWPEVSAPMYMYM